MYVQTADPADARFTNLISELNHMIFWNQVKSSENNSKDQVKVPPSCTHYHTKYFLKREVFFTIGATGLKILHSTGK